MTFELTHYDYEHQCWITASPTGRLFVGKCGHVLPDVTCYSCMHYGETHTCTSADACPEGLVG